MRSEDVLIGQPCDKRCPPKGLLADFVNQTIGEDEVATVAAHVMKCGNCQAYVRFYSQWECAGGEELSLNAELKARQIVTIARHAASLKIMPAEWRCAIECLLPRKEYLAAAKGQNEDDVHHENIVRCGFIEFKSLDGFPPEESWRVKIVIPVINPTLDTEIEVQVMNGIDGSPVEEGQLKLFGLDLPVIGGYASLTERQFKDNCLYPMISLKRQLGREIGGTIVIM